MPVPVPVPAVAAAPTKALNIRMASRMIRLRSAVTLCGSLRTTLLLFAYFALSIAYYYFNQESSEWWLALPLFLFALNLLCAITTNAAFRQRLPLLVFHLGLLMILLLVGVGRLTYLKGEVEVTEGEQMPAGLSRYRSGVLHELNEAGIGFQLEHFDIEFDEYQYKRFIRSSVKWRDESGREMRYTIADMEPLIQSGYRFYSTKHKGFAPIFLWQPEDGAPQLGTIHLPAYPENEFNQSKEWQIPGTTQTVWAMLQFDETIITVGAPSKFRIPNQHTLIVRHDAQRAELQPGQQIEVAGGQLTYKGLRTWMGFVVFYDWTLPWLLAASLFTVLALAWHYWRCINARPWQAEGAGEPQPGTIKS